MQIFFNERQLKTSAAVSADSRSTNGPADSTLHACWIFELQQFFFWALMTFLKLTGQKTFSHHHVSVWATAGSHTAALSRKLWGTCDDTHIHPVTFNARSAAASRTSGGSGVRLGVLGNVTWVKRKSLISHLFEKHKLIQRSPADPWKKIYTKRVWNQTKKKTRAALFTLCLEIIKMSKFRITMKKMDDKYQ